MAWGVNLVDRRDCYAFSVIDYLGNGRLLTFLWVHDLIEESWSAKMVVYDRGLGSGKVLLHVSSAGVALEELEA